MNVAFRVDANQSIGIGHLIRCLGLCEELKRRGNSCFFVSKIYNEDLILKIKNENNFYKLSPSIDLKQDVKELISFSNKKKIDWIITDNYELNEKYITEIKKNDFKVLSIDDYSQIHYESDIVLNQNIGSDKLRYSSGENTYFLLGPKYVILRDKLLIRHKKIQKNEVNKILIMLGGTDKDNLILKIIKSIKFLTKQISFIVVIGPLNHHYNEISKYVKENQLNIDVEKFPDQMEEIYLNSDISISAGGTSCYELAYFGIPNIIITIAKNQINIAKNLDKYNVSLYLGHKNQIDMNKIKNNCYELINNNNLRKKMILNGKNLVDGKGKERIIDFMESFN